jgi:hypothetical protein
MIPIEAAQTKILLIRGHSVTNKEITNCDILGKTTYCKGFSIESGYEHGRYATALNPRALAVLVKT